MRKKERKELEKFVSNEFKKRLDNIWEDMSEDNMFQNEMKSKFGLNFLEGLDEGVYDHLSWIDQLIKLTNKLKKYEEV